MLLLLLAACPGGKTGSIGDVTAEVSPVIPTVVTVSWTSDVEGEQVLHYGTTDALGQTLVASGEGGTYEAVILGLPTETDVYYKVVAGEAESEVGNTRTGVLGSDLPVLTVTGESDQYIVTTLLGATTGATIIDPQGRIVWWYPEERELDVYRTVISRDRSSIIYNAASVSGDPAANSSLVRVSLDGTEVQDIPVPLLAHDFVELPDGTIAAMVVEYRDHEGEELRGDQIVEIAPDGTQTVVWSAWDCFDPAVDIGTDQEQGWTFANALDYSESEDAYYLSLRNFSSIVRIDRATGECPWVFGTTAANVVPDESSETFLHQHQFQVLDDSILVFDNDGAAGNVSRVLEYSYSGGETATEIWSYTADPTVYTFVLGEPVRLADGDTMVDWAVNGQIERVGADGTLEWQLKSGLGFAFGFMHVTATP